MKKFYVGLTAVLMGATLFLTLPANAQIEVGLDPGSIKCYTTYDSGTTTFTKCNGCTETTGTNLQDKDTCKN